MDIIKHQGWQFDNLKNKSIFSYPQKNSTETYFHKYEGEILSPKITQPNELNIGSFRKAGLIHKLVRNEVRNKIHAGVKFIDLEKDAESIVKKYIKPGENGGFAFPLGISVNEISAHDSAMIGDERVFKANDIVKIDIGIHVDGCIIDSAFTMIVDGTEDFVDNYQPLLDATADATYTGIRLSGPDANLFDISTAIKETIESYELGNGDPISAVYGLGGHNILPYKVHGGKLLLSSPHPAQKGSRMVEDEVYAIETFASTGTGKISQKDICSCNHFMLNDDEKLLSKLDSSKNPVVNWARTQNQSLPFTQLWCTEIKNLKKSFDDGIREKVIVPYPPLTDVKNTFTSQLEHTIHVKEYGVEIFSLGTDY